MSIASRYSSQHHRKNMEENQEEEVVVKQEKQEQEEDEPVKCITLYKRGGGRTGSNHNHNNNNNVYGLSGKGQWRQEQRLRASRMEHHLGIRCSLEDLIQEQLSRFDGHYSRALGQQRRLKDMGQILMPAKSRFPVEMACLSWYGNWRPSSILSLVQSFSRTLKTSSSSSSGVTGSTPLSRSERVLSDLIKQTRTEELILDEEMAEIQANCILHLPFKKASGETSSVAAADLLSCVFSEFKKIDRVYNQAQKLRYRTLELVVKKLLNQSQAAEFLVAFAGIQEMVHEFAVRQKKGPISVIIKSNNGMQQLIDSYLSSVDK